MRWAWNWESPRETRSRHRQGTGDAGGVRRRGVRVRNPSAQHDGLADGNVLGRWPAGVAGGDPTTFPFFVRGLSVLLRLDDPSDDWCPLDVRACADGLAHRTPWSRPQPIRPHRALRGGLVRLPVDGALLPQGMGEVWWVRGVFRRDDDRCDGRALGTGRMAVCRH